MEVDGAAPYSTTSGAKHDLMHKQEVSYMMVQHPTVHLVLNMISCTNRR